MTAKTVDRIHILTVVTVTKNQNNAHTDETTRPRSYSTLFTLVSSPPTQSRDRSTIVGRRFFRRPLALLCPILLDFPCLGPTRYLVHTYDFTSPVKRRKTSKDPVKILVNGHLSLHSDSGTGIVTV